MSVQKYDEQDQEEEKNNKLNLKELKMLDLEKNYKYGYNENDEHHFGEICF